MKLVIALLLLPVAIAFNSIKGAFIATAQGPIAAILLWVFLAPVMIIISIVIGIGLTLEQFRECPEIQDED